MLNAYTLYDSKALAYSPPFFCNAHGEAVRMLMQLAGDLNTTVGRHPGDFTLYCIGRFDPSVGFMLPADVREHIADAAVLAPVSRQPEFFDSQRPSTSSVNGGK